MEFIHIGSLSLKDFFAFHDRDTSQNLDVCLREFVDEYRQLRPKENFRAISYMDREVPINNPNEKCGLFNFEKQLAGLLNDLEDPRRQYDVEWVKLWDFWRFGNSIVSMQKRIDQKK